MTAAVFDLTAQAHTASTLDRFLAGRPGAIERAGIHAADQSPTTGLSADDLVRVLGMAGPSAAGVPVTADAALRVSTVYGCVSLLTGAVAMLPFAIFERDGSNRRRAEHDYWWMLNEQANDTMTAAAAWEQLVGNKLFHGDGYAELLRPSNFSARVIGWQPLDTLRVTPFEADDGLVHYRYQPRKGQARVIQHADMVHLPSLGFDGLNSPSPITYAAREAIGTAIAAEGYTARFFAGGATFDYALKTASNLKTEQIADLRTSLLARLAGNTRAPLILTGGLEPAQLTINSKDAEILATRLFGVEEICRIFGVPPHMVGHTDKVTSWGSGIESQGIGFVRYSLQRLLTPIQQEFNRKLWPTRQRYFVEHVTAALERGDLKTRYEAYRIALGRAGEMPWVDTDEIRRIENMPPNSKLQLNQGNAHEKPTDPAAQ